MNTPALDLFLCGDVMTGRGIDQLLPQPGRPNLYEGYVTDARDYVRLAEQASGPIRRPVSLDYVWGEALAEIDRRSPQLRIVNLETAITTCEDAWPGKGIHYRMHPANAGCLSAARIDACVLANNHVLDWGARGSPRRCACCTKRASARPGWRRRGAGGGAGRLRVSRRRRLLLFAAADEASGVPRRWRATHAESGVRLLDEVSARGAQPLARAIARSGGPATR